MVPEAILTSNFPEVFKQTLNLISLYKKTNLPIPSSLKGSLGEIWVTMELKKLYPNCDVRFFGGSHPGFDVSIKSGYSEEIKIQVKSQIKKPAIRRKKYQYDYESSPTIKKADIDKNKCDVIVLLIFYLNDDYSSIIKTNKYIFLRKEFPYFKTVGCWSGKSKGDYTIFNVLEEKGELPPKQKEKISFYNTLEYKQLFRQSKDWKKIKSLL
jgi:hypothetical protein